MPDGCAYLIDDAAGRHNCSAPQQLHSPYCAHHHAICYVALGSWRERRRLWWFEKLADKVGKGRHPLGWTRRLAQGVFFFTDRAAFLVAPEDVDEFCPTLKLMIRGELRGGGAQGNC
jgi:hypothetical protein